MVRQKHISLLLSSLTYKLFITKNTIPNNKSAINILPINLNSGFTKKNPKSFFKNNVAL